MKTIRTEVSIICLGICMCLAVSSPVHAADDGDYVQGEILVKFKPAASRGNIKSINRNNNCQTIKRFDFIDVYHMKIKSGLPVQAVVNMYRSNPNVEFATPNRYLYATERVANNAEKLPNDATFDDTHSDYGKQWSMDNWGQTIAGVPGTVDADIDAPQMWKMVTDSDVIVAVLDTGVD